MSYTATNPYITSYTFPGLVSGDLDFSSIVANEVDYGTFNSFTDYAPFPDPANFLGMSGIVWAGYQFGVYAPNSSTTITLNYSVAEAAGSGNAITSVAELLQVDSNLGPGTSATATESVYDTSNNLIGTVTWSAASGTALGSVDLSAGYQQVNVVLTINESIDSSGGPGSQISVSILGQYFGETPTSQLASISSNVFCDENDNGIYAPGDFGLSGVTVELLNSTGTQVLQTTTTDSNGNYSFSNLTAGTYETQVEIPTGSGDQYSTANQGLDTVTLTPGEADNAAPTGLFMPAVIGVNVYDDINNIGTFVAGDTGLSGVTVDLFNVSTSQEQTAVTDVNGNATFTGLLPGVYEVLIPTPAGDTVTQATNVGTLLTLESCGTVNAIEGLYVTNTGGGGLPSTPDVEIVKSVTSVGGVAGDPAATYAGEVIDYSIVVTNTGTENLTDVVVTDPTLGIALATLATMAVGTSVTYSVSATVTQAELDAKVAIPNTAVVTDDQTPSQSSTVSTTVSLTPGVSIVKSVTSVGGVGGDPAATFAGEVIDYQIVVANTGDETLTNVAVTDPTLGVAYATLASLAVGASVTYTASATVTQAELDAKAAVPNTAVVTDDQTPSQSSTVSTTVSLTPGVSIVKSVTSVGGVGGDPAATYAGEVIDYQIVVANTGDETLTNVAVTDPTLGVAYATLASLAVGASVTYTASATVTQAELDAKAAVPNTAVVTDTQTPSQSSTISTTVSLTPGVSIVKSVTSVGGVGGDPAATYAGEVIDYQIVVANTGDETLTNVAVTDPTLGVAYATLASLAVGASVTYTASATVTQAELDAKAAVPNTAVVTDTQTPSQSSTVSTTVSLTPGVSIVKSVTSVGGVGGDPAATYAGEVIDYQIVVANTGDETLTNVAVTDPTLGVAYATLASLAVGASVTYTASATVTQAELDAKAAVPNTAIVTDDQTPSQSSTVSTTVSLTPGVSIVKSVTSVGGVGGDPAATYAGEVIDYQIVVANTGDETLTNVAVTDPTLGVAYATLASLAVGASVTYTASATVTQAELDAKAAVPNTAVVTDTQTPSQSSTVSTTVSLTPGVSIVKSVTSVGGVGGDPAATYAGEVIDYQIVVANTGDETLTNVAVTDPTLGIAYATLASLAVGASVTYTASATVTQAELDAKAAVPNTAVVTDSQTPSQSSTVSTTVSLTPGVSIVKSVTSVGGVGGDPAATYAGEVIDYQIVVANTGDETLTNVAVTDPTLGIAYATLASLAVGASVTYTASATVTQAELDAKAAVPNTAVVTDSQTPSQSSTVSTNVSLTPGVSIVKSVTSVGGVGGDPAATYAGEVIDYQIVVANTGDETLTNVAVTDPTLGIAYATLASLAVGASVTYTASATVTQAELDAKAAVPNTAVVTDTQTPSQSSTVSTTVSLTPGVSIVKSVTSVGGVGGDPAATYAGEVIDYQIVVANTGDETLTNVAVTDPTLGVAYATLASLAVGASVTYTASATVTQAELDAKAAVPNTAVVTDTQTPSQSSTVSTNVSLTPGVSIVKSVTSVGGVGGDPAATYAGEVIDYQIVVANTGDETLTNVAVTDPTLGIAYATLASLAVGASVTYTASATLTQAELDAKAAVPNTAVVTDTQTPSQSSTVSTTVSLTPGVSIVKSVTSVGGVGGDPAATYAGEVIDYQIVVANTGDETLTNVAVTDPTLGVAYATLASLAVGASVTYTASATVTQAELDAKAAVPNTAVVTDSQTPSQSSTVSTTVSLTPGVSIVKSVTSVGGVGGDPAATYAGEVIDYQIVVANTGDETLTNVAVTDPTLGVAYATLASLAVGASVTYTASATVTQAELDAKAAVPNTAVVTDTQTPSQSSTVSTTVSLTPGVSIVKSVTSVGGVGGDPAATYAGEVIDYKIVVANTGDETLTNVAVTDPTLGIAYATLASLAVGASVTYTASATVTQAELDAKAAVPNTAVVTDTQTPSQSSTVSTTVSLTPGVSIVKSVTSVGGVGGDPAATYAGEVIDYKIVVANTGDETLTNVAVTDPTLGIAYATLASLAVGASVTYTASATVTQAELDAKAAVPNTAVVTDTQTPSQSSTVSTTVSLTPGVSIVKSVTSVGGVGGDPAATYAGEVIDYQIVVANTGDETLTNVAVTDPTLGIAYATLASLAVGASVTYTASATVTQAELDAKAAVPNTAVVTDTQTPSQSSTVSTTVSLTPGVSIVKSVTSVGGVGGDPAATYAGEVIDYQIVVANTGDETLTNVAVTDPTLGIAYATLASLAVGASVTYTASATVTQAELDAKAAVPNTAVVTDTQTPSQSSTVSTNVSLTPGVSIVKSVTSVGGVGGDPAATYAGEVIDYKIVVANTGDETLTNVAVTDPTLGVAYATLASLAVGASVTYTASATVTQAELDAKAAVPNTAVVTDTQTPSQSSTVSTNVSLTPGVSIVKSVTSVGGVGGDPAATYAGEVIDYKIVVANTGDETLTNVAVTDPTLGVAYATLASLAVGASVTYTASATVTQAELDAKVAIPNTAVVTDTQTPSQSSTVSTNVSLTPGVSIVKSVTSVGGVGGDPAATYAGEVIDYQIVVANTGDETLTNVAVTDPTLGVAYATLASLAVGASVTYTASATVTQAELDAKAAVPNTAVVTDTQTPSQSSTVSTNVSLTPGVSIVKSVTSVGGVGGDPAATYAGEVIDYKIVVANTGDETLTNVAVTDPTLGIAYATLASLAVGASVTYTASATVTQAELDAKAAVPNTAVVTDTQTPSQSSTVSTATTCSPGVSIVKSVTSVGGVAGDPAATYAGEAIDYKIVVTNTGSQTLTNVVVDDTTLGTVLGTLASLAPGATATYTVSQAVTQAELDQGQICTTSPSSSQTCSVSTQGLGSGCTAWLNSSFAPTSCQNGATYTFQNITCTVTGPYCGTNTISLPNACVTFSSSCTQATTVYDASTNCWNTTLPAGCNPGNVFLTGLPCQIPSGYNLSGATLCWTIGQSANNCGSSNVAWQTGCQGYNNFSVNGCNGLTNYNQIGVQVCDNLSNYGSSGACGGSSGCAGTPVSQCCTGNCGCGSTGTGTCGNGGGSGSISCVGSITNTATVTDTQGVTGTSTASTSVTQSPGVSIVKSVTSVGGVSGDPAATFAGEVIDYKIVVTNTGNETLTNVLVNDTTLGTPLGTLASLAVGATATYSASQTVTQAELNSNGPVTNTATVTDTQNMTATSTASTAVTGHPGVSIVKSVTSVGGVAGDPTATVTGEAIDYSIVVSNTGSQTLTNVVVKDTTLNTTLGTLASLAVGASVTYTASQTVTQSELSSGAAVTNTATVSDSQNVTGTSTASTAVKETGGISIIKLPSHVAVTTCGQVTYTFDVTNTGSTTLTNVQVVDNIGTAANPDYVTAVPELNSKGFNVGDTNDSGSLNPGETWVYTETVNQIGGSSNACGTVTHTIGGSNLGAGCTAWLSSTFNPKSCANGATYVFQGVTCTISGVGVGGNPITEQCPNAVVTFSSSCTQASTTYNSSTNCWVTTLPANSNPGSVFLSGLPLTVPSGCNLNNCSVTWSIADSSNNCGASNVSWDTTCVGFNSFDQNGCNGLSNYNQIGVQACDNSGNYGYGNTCAGTPSNQCTWGNYNSNCYSQQGCGSSGSCGCTGTCTSTGSTNITGVADTVTVTAMSSTCGPLMANTVLQDFNAVVYTNASTPSDIQGAVVVGGNFSGATVNNSPSGTLPTGYGALTVYGSTSGNWINLDDGGNAYVGGTKGAGINFNGGGSYISAPPNTIADFESSLNALALALSQLSATSTLPTTGNNEVIKATPGANGIAVFDITSAQLAAIPSFTINLNGASTVVFNVSGSSDTFSANDESGTNGAGNIIWNFYNATTVNLTTAIGGTVLATGATVSNANQIDGALVANSLTGSGELHDIPFCGTLPTSCTTVTASDTKEVQILASNSNVTVNGTGTTSSLSSVYGTAQTLEFAYNPGDTVSTKTIGAGLASVSGNNTNSMAFMEISNNANPYASGASIYFEGSVTSGEDIYADATTNVLTNTAIPGGHFSTTAGADIFAYVFASQAAFEAGASPIQTMSYNTSGSQQMHLGDVIGSLTVVGYVGSSGGHLVTA